MAEKKSKGKVKLKRAAFSLEAPGAKEVFLLGNFNNLDPGENLMKKEKTGIWKKFIMVPPGRYEYKFVVDGKWRNNPNSKDSCHNCYGTCNNDLVSWQS